MSDLPRLLYLADVPVEASYHGSALLFRLLQNYPADRLRVIENNLSLSRPDRRLPGVSYSVLAVGIPRILNTRLHDWYSQWLSLRSTAAARQVPALLGSFNPDAVLTVGHGYSWVTAARCAAERELPLHLVIHDDWPSVVADSSKARVDRQFGDVFRQAASRLCVSPEMAREFERRYGAAASVLYPARAADAPVFPGPPERLRASDARLNVAFAGTINSPGYSRLLRRLADCLEPHGGQLLVFGPLSPDQAAAAALGHPRIRVCGLLPPALLMSRLRDEADVLFVPMSFAPEDRMNMQFSFPSKLTDYTALALPLLICGPSYCSAVHWANAHPGVAETVTSEEPGALVNAIGRLAGDGPHRWRLAEKAKAVGDRLFSASAAQAVFLGALTAGAPATAAARR